MDNTSTQKQYLEISFNNQPHKDDTINNKLQSQSITNQQKIYFLLEKVTQLQKQLQKEKHKSSQLQKRNQQLTNMLVSASQSNVKRNHQFIRQVQRKIYNYQAKKELSCSQFDSTNKQVQKNYEEINNNHQMRIKTQSAYESTKSILLQKIIKEERNSHQGTSKNKENMNSVNLRNTSQCLSHKKLEMKNYQNLKTQTLTQRSSTKFKQSSRLSSTNDHFMNKIHSKIDLIRRDQKAISKISTKVIRN